MDARCMEIKFERDPCYLSDEDLAILTGYRNKRLQVDQLEKMGIPFALSICREPIVPVTAIEGSLTAGRREAKEIQDRLDSLLRRHEMEAKMRHR